MSYEFGPSGWVRIRVGVRLRVGVRVWVGVRVRVRVRYVFHIES